MAEIIGIKILANIGHPYCLLSVKNLSIVLLPVLARALLIKGFLISMSFSFLVKEKVIIVIIISI